MERDFSIVFEKLHEATAPVEGLATDADTVELDEIAELRRVVMEITEPESMSYTTT
jgi:hypothetical protein